MRQTQLVDANVDIKTSDGICDAAFIHPAIGVHAGVIMWPDVFGLRPSMRDIASFHGGGLVTDGPDSPHLLAPKIKARTYFAVAQNADAQQPDAKTTLRDAFEAAKVPVQVELYPAQHGWCVPDMPGSIFSEADAGG